MFSIVNIRHVRTVCTRVNIANMPTQFSPAALEGITLKAIVTTLVERIGWEAMGEAVPVRCFMIDPSLKSSLTFLRRTPWARKRVEELYLRTLNGDG